MTSPLPNKLPPDYNIDTLQNTEVNTYNALCQLYAIGQLCNCVTKDYNYVCRLRNDLLY